MSILPGWTAQTRARLFAAGPDAARRDPSRVILTVTAMEDRNAPGNLMALSDLLGDPVALAGAVTTADVGFATPGATRAQADAMPAPQSGRGELGAVEPVAMAFASDPPADSGWLDADTLWGAPPGANYSLELPAGGFSFAPTATDLGGEDSAGAAAAPQSSPTAAPPPGSGSGADSGNEASWSVMSGSGSGTGTGTGTGSGPPGGSTGTYLIGDRVWEDHDENGAQDAGEPGVEGATVKLYKADGTLLATTTSGSTGGYNFQRGGDGSDRYYVTVTKPGWIATYQARAPVSTDYDSDIDEIDGSGRSPEFGMGVRHESSPGPYWTNYSIDAGLIPIPQTDIDILGTYGNPAQGFTEETEVTIGGLVVRRVVDNNAPRQEVVVNKAVVLGSGYPEWVGKVSLSRGDGAIRVFTAATGGSEITFNGTDNKFANADLPKRLYVQGEAGSIEMRDNFLKTRPVVKGQVRDEGMDEVKYTVLWINMDVATTGAVSPNNDKRENYRNWTVDHVYDLDFRLYNNFNNYTARVGWGTEARGAVSPGNFDYPGSSLSITREWAYGDYVVGGQTYLRGFQDDTGDATTLDNTPADSGGFIYDFDASGWVHGGGSPQGTVVRIRHNFKTNAVVTTAGNVIKASAVYSYFVRFSTRQTGVGTANEWELINPADVIGDNRAGAGQTNLTIDLT